MHLFFNGNRKKSQNDGCFHPFSALIKSRWNPQKSSFPHSKTTSKCTWIKMILFTGTIILTSISLKYDPLLETNFQSIPQQDNNKNGMQQQNEMLKENQIINSICWQLAMCISFQQRRAKKKTRTARLYVARAHRKMIKWKKTPPMEWWEEKNYPIHINTQVVQI